MNEDYNSNKTQWTVDVQVLVVGDGGAYVVMEHCHGTYAKPQQKLRQTLHFSIWVVVGSFFSRLSFP